MGQYNKAILTAAGENLVARAVAGEILLNITKAKTSNYKYPDSTDFKALTDMQGVKQVMDSPETKVLNDDLIQTRTLFGNEKIQTTYYIQNVGLYAMDGTEEVLFCIVTAATPDEMPQYNGVASTSYIYNVQTVVQEAAEIHITVHPSGIASIQDVMERVKSDGGDISETVIETLENVDEKFPIPSKGERVKVFLGKVRKCLFDLVGAIGKPNGIAQLDAAGKVPESQLPPQPEIRDATLSQKGIVQLSNATDDYDDSKAVTPSALYLIRRNTSLLGKPTAPQAGLGDNSDQIANTAFVYNEIRNKIFLTAKLSGLTTVNGDSCMDFTQSYDLRSTRLVTAAHNTYGPVWRNNAGKSIYVIIQLYVRFDTVTTDTNPLRYFSIATGTSLSSTSGYATLLYAEERDNFRSNGSKAYTCFGAVPTGCWILPSCQLLKGDALYNRDCTFSIAEF
ncbi:tail fiber protein [Lacrimispora sp.]|uniref:tail fiber protein n=1 Tax=Lacrimispora sp. TaxID=2719234 RepID=UPI0028AC0F8B|nr:tail fiber protein [Lacrimispora sp.]